MSFINSLHNGVGAGQEGCEGGVAGVLLNDLISALGTVLQCHPNQAGQNLWVKRQHCISSYTVFFNQNMPRCQKNAEMSDFFPSSSWFYKDLVQLDDCLHFRAFFSWCKLFTTLKILLLLMEIWECGGTISGVFCGLFDGHYCVM